MREWYRSNREAWKERTKEWYWMNRKKALETRAAYRRRLDLRRKIVEAYGGACECCGESEPAFLSIDHINGRGQDSKRRGGWALYRDLEKAGFPKDNYRLLCMNCNCALGFFGACPHRPGVHQHHPRLRVAR
jgi:hypothetical protein